MKVTMPAWATCVFEMWALAMNKYGGEALPVHMLELRYPLEIQDKTLSAKLGRLFNPGSCLPQLCA